MIFLIHKILDLVAYIMEICNICGSAEYIDFNGRQRIQCATCKSLERHRLVRWTLEKLGYVSGNQRAKRALHLAPEEMTHQYLAESLGVGYVCSDLVPSKYPHAQCLKLALPEGFNIFPDIYFDLILHNHVLEHIPGEYRDHLAQFVRILHPGGHMVFTLPGISRTVKTIQGGEHLPTDAERLRCHGQSDHYKSFGYDLVEWFSSVPGVFGPLEIPAEVRTSLRAPSDSIFVYSKA
jgi:SAM-dependent methyltransferase